MPRSLSSLPFRLLLAATALAFGGYALLLPVVPLWVSRGGSGEFGAGLSTGVLMAATVATQLLVPAMLRRVGHRPVLVVGSLLLGLPTPLLALTADLGPVLAISTVRWSWRSCGVPGVLRHPAATTPSRTPGSTPGSTAAGSPPRRCWRCWAAPPRRAA